MNILIDEQIQAQQYLIEKLDNDDGLRMANAILATLESIKAAEAGLPVESDIKWIHKFINCVPFGADAPVSDIQRAHKVIESLHAYAVQMRAERDEANSEWESERRDLKHALAMANRSADDYMIQKREIAAALQVAQQDRDNCYASLDVARRRMHEIEEFVGGDTKIEANDDWREAMAEITNLRKRAEKADAENAALREDAERYRSKRKIEYEETRQSSLRVTGKEWQTTEEKFNDYYDAAIDQARKL